ncbi:putative late blight resistance protein homolog R1A-4 [Andrographis paniculata]|uniref:putative late blight resistance protein homolog R1A-4 n=1 Tax=Andrographis paniculata TaxID=175694 RepID=UPI0021E80E82|nr:putative late blight resistance protein homolog R1A-4 [Andrographis paniculata]
MAVVAYASLVSLTHVLDNLHYRAHFNLPRADIKQVEALKENVNFLLQFLELHSTGKSPELQGLWRQMTEAATGAESAINFHVGNLLNLRYRGEKSDASGFSALCEEMETLIEKLCSIKKELPVIEEDGEDNEAQKQSNAFISAGGSSEGSSYVSNVIVGLEEHVDKIRDKLIRGSFDLQILPIVGMGGIGKTTLAKSVFDDSFVVNHFDLRIWLSISQQYSVEQILKVGLDEKVGENRTRESLDELGTRFYKKLFGRRYLIVMDDMWTTEAWDDLRRYCPNNKDGSRILLTTRLSDMAASLRSYDPYHLIFLDQNESWSLFCQNAFSLRGCPYGHLEKFAKDIAKSCRGLPLEIVVVGRLLANSDMTLKHWENVARNISSLVDLGDDDHCMSILSLSYENLPIDLKLCFLYMRVFPEDRMIFVSELIHLWIVEGFIKPVHGRNLEDIGSEYVKGLIDRNLIFRSGDDKCGIHDLLRDLCLKESNKEHFLRFPRVQSVDEWLVKGIVCNHCCKKVKDSERLHVLKPSYIFESSSRVNPSICDACNVTYSHITRHCFVRIAIYDEEEILQPIELRHVNLDAKELLSPSTIHLLWNLQYLRIDLDSTLVVLRSDIWEMPQLRVIRSSDQLFLPNPITTDIEGKDFLILNELHTIDEMRNVKFTKEIIDRIPNLKNLSVVYDYDNEEGMEKSNFSLCNLDQLQKLESLSLSFSSENMSFPNSLKNLSLTNCEMSWEDMSNAGLLPNLETLEIYGPIKGLKWKPGVGEFLRLKKLKMQRNYLVHWRVGAASFPKLEKLRLTSLKSLKKIPSSVGDIHTLQSIVLDDCSHSAIDSVKKLWEEQFEVGNEITIRVINLGDVSYTVGTCTARMTAAACESLATLKYLQQKTRGGCSTWLRFSRQKTNRSFERRH